MMRRASPLLLLAVLLSTCKPRIPGNVLSRDKMEQVLYDYHLAQSIAELQYDSVAPRRYANVMAVFKKHKITEAEFDSSMVWYSAHSYELRDIYSRLADRFETDIEASGASDGLSNLDFANADTTQIWPGRTLYYIQSTHTSRFIKVVLQADSSSFVGDEYLWRFDATIINRGAQHAASATLMLIHEGDSVTTTSRSITSTGSIELRLRQANGMKLQKLCCYIHMPLSDPDKAIASLVISRPMLVRFHHNLQLR